MTIADLPPATVLAARKPHGVRLRYMAGCRCADCRRANTQYELARAKARKAGDWNGIVDAGEARRHIHALSRKGVGYKMVAEVADLPASIVLGIRMKRRKHCRARTARKILAVTIGCRGDKTLVSGKQPWQRIAYLLEEGFTKTRIARELGSTAAKPALQLRRERVTVRSAARVEKLYRRYAL